MLRVGTESRQPRVLKKVHATKKDNSSIEQTWERDRIELRNSGGFGEAQPPEILTNRDGAGVHPGTRSSLRLGVSNER